MSTIKQCVKFPEDKFLAVRSCLVAICMGNRPAAHLLSILLFRYNLRMENKDDAENQNAVKAAKGESPDQDTSVRIFRTQAQLVDDMCGEITDKTLHNTAVPMLQLLGFLDLEEHMIANCYILHVERVQQALNLYIPGKKEQPQLEKFLISTMQLEKFLITSEELEKSLIDKKNFQSQLEKVLIQNRKTSNYNRGRKPKPEAERKAKLKRPKNLEEDSKKDREEESALSFDERTARTRSELIDDINETGADVIDGIERLTESGKHKAVTPATLNEAAKGAANAQQTPSQPVVAVAAPTSPAASVSPPSSNGTAQRTAVGRNHARAQPKPQLTLQGQQVREWYEAIRGKVRLTDKNTIAFSNLGDEPEMTYDNLKDVLEAWDNDKWAKEHNMVPSPQELDSGYLTFEKGLQIVKRNRKTKAKAKPPEEDNPYSLAALAARQAAALQGV